jgi:YVTN family beta-propeller protein
MTKYITTEGSEPDPDRSIDCMRDMRHFDKDGRYIFSSPVVGFMAALARETSAQMALAYAYVANSGDNTVTKINLSTFLKVSSALAVGSYPCSIAIDPTGTYAYVANNNDSTVSKINLSTFLTVGSALAVGSGPQSIAIDPTGTYAYVANFNANTVTKINLSTFTAVGSALAVGSAPYSIAIAKAKITISSTFFPLLGLN